MIIDHIIQLQTIMYIIIHASVFSWLEVEMEGKHGWAVNLPTSCAFGGWTWYHIAMNVLVLLTVAGVTRLYHSKFQNFWGKYIATALVYVFRVAVWFCVEDIMWFVINKHYGIHRYTKKDIFWHADKTWLFGTLLLNWIVFIAAIIIGFIEKLATNKTTVFKETSAVVVFLIISCIISLRLTYETNGEEMPNKALCFGAYSTVFNRPVTNP